MVEYEARQAEAATRTFDVIVIGGGINGAGIAHTAARRGLDVLLLDQHDWGFGTTWRSTKLIHGGLRYLEYGEVGLVFESLRDRTRLLRSAAHLVRPLPLLLPSFKDDRHAMPALRAGLTMYDLLALRGGLPRPHVLSRAQALKAEPTLRAENLRGGLAYWDSQVALPERLCFENVRRAQEWGAWALNYTRVEGLLTAGGRVVGVQAADLIGGGSYEFRAPIVVNAAGPWVDAVLRSMRMPADRIGGTRGAHIVVAFPGGGPRRPLYAEAEDNRPFFVLPWRGVHLIGTTDVRVDDPEDLLPSDEEIDYLVSATTRLVPGAAFTRGDVWYAFAGVRPLPKTTDSNAGAITRRHHIVDHADEGRVGLYSVIGGKLSTYHALGEQVTERLFRRLGRPAPHDADADGPLVPGDWRPAPVDPEEQRLWRIYGPRAAEVIALRESAPELSRPLCPHTRETAAQAVYAVRHEGARTLGDILLRRTPAGWSPCMALDAALATAAHVGPLLGWDAARQQAEVEAYKREVAANFRTLDR